MKPRHLGRAAVFALVLTAIGCVHKPTAPKPFSYPAIDSEAALIQNLTLAYQRLDYDRFQILLASDPSTRAAFLFRMNPPLPNGDRQWNRDTELCIHRRMFKPKSAEPGLSPVPPELTVTRITASLTLTTAFQERLDLYIPTDPGGFDPSRYRVTDALYNTGIFLQTKTDDNYVAEGTANFVVLMDKTKSGAEPGRFLLYQWEDLGAQIPKPLGVVAASWATIKNLYRCGP